MMEMLSLVPFVFLCAFILDGTRAVPVSFGLSFAVAVVAFTLSLTVLEWKERKEAAND